MSAPRDFKYSGKKPPYIAPAMLARIIVTRNKRRTGVSSGCLDPGFPINVMGLILQLVTGFLEFCSTDLIDFIEQVC